MQHDAVHARVRERELAGVHDLGPDAEIAPRAPERVGARGHTRHHGRREVGRDHRHAVGEPFEIQSGAGPHQ